MAELDLTKFLDKAHETQPLHEVLRPPVSALQGVSDKDAEALKAAFGIKTVEDMGRNKYLKVAQALVQMHEFGK